MIASLTKSVFLSLLLTAFGLDGVAAEPSPPPKVAKVPSAELRSLAGSLGPAQNARLLMILNRGARASISELPGIGPARAAAIERSRPFSAPIQLLQIPGFGEVLVKGILLHARSGFPRSAQKSTR